MKIILAIYFFPCKDKVHADYYTLMKSKNLDAIYIKMTMQISLQYSLRNSEGL